jgi:hypothetical protein
MLSSHTFLLYMCSFFCCFSASCLSFPSSFMRALHDFLPTIMPPHCTFSQNGLVPNTHYTWVYFLRQKFEFFEHLKDFKALVETQTRNTIKILHTDNGGEYINKYVQKLCHEASIQEMTSCMLHGRSFPSKIWAEELNYASYIHKRSPHKYFEDRTPFESWTCDKPNVRHFCIFGSRAWAHIPYEKRKALDPQSTPCIFVGYPDDVKGY